MDIILSSNARYFGIVNGRLKVWNLETGELAYELPLNKVDAIEPEWSIRGHFGAQ